MKKLIMLALLASLFSCRESSELDGGMSGATMTGATMTGATMTGATMTGATMTGGDVGGAGSTTGGDVGGAGSTTGGDVGGAGSTTGGDVGGMMLPSTYGSISFKAVYGSAARNQFDALWRPSIPGYGGNSPLVLMLCHTDDPKCRNPQWTHEVSETETNGDPIQGSFGPDITVTQVPTGEYLLMIFADSERSRELGFGWQDMHPSNGDWGGIISETDLLWSADDDQPSEYHNPEPMARLVNVQENQTLALETVTLGHFFHRDISPPKEFEDGLIVVATLNGLRLIDTNTFSVQEVVPNSNYYEHQMVDAQGDALQAEVCGLIKGPNQSVFVLFKEQNQGFAIQYNPFTKEQSAGRIVFPNATQACRGIYFENAQGAHLAVINAPSSRMVSGTEGVWLANFNGNVDQTITANYYSSSTVNYLRYGFGDVAYANNQLYFSISLSAQDRNTGLDECLGKHCILEVALNNQLTFPMSGDTQKVWIVDNQAQGIQTPQGEIACVGENGYLGLSAQNFHDGRTLLFAGGCTQIYVYDLMSKSKLDYNGALPGKPGLDGTSFGQGFGQFTLSPDGTILYALPQTKSSKHFNFKLDGVADRRQTYNRYMVLPIALNQGPQPELSPAFVGEDIDDFNGDAGFGDLSPAQDPGIDLNIGHLIKYIVGWSGALAGSTPGSASIPIGPELAAGHKTLWVRGSGATGVSGLGKGGNLVLLSVQHAQPILWPQEGEEFYRVWMNGAQSTPQWGYDLTPENQENIATRGILFLSR